MGWTRRLFLAGLFTTAGIAGDAARMAPVPSDPLELVSGEIQTADTAPGRQAALELLDRARKNYALQTAGQAYDLKVSFRVDSGGETQYDGLWQMEDVFAPKLGHRWTANSGAYGITEIASGGKLYSEGAANFIPLRLQEARAALFGAIPAASDLAHDVIRTAAGSYQGVDVTCVLFTGAANAVTDATGRRWEETEECIDPQSGLLMVHSQVPGRYYAYDYSNAPQVAGHLLPRKVTITEGGKVVSEISVDSLKVTAAVDAGQFLPSDEMKARGRAVAMAGAVKISRVVSGGAASARPVCVFGLVTASGEMVEAHSLQPSDPNSSAAVEAVRAMDFSRPVAGDLRLGPRQRFVFVIVRFGGE